MNTPGKADHQPGRFEADGGYDRLLTALGELILIKAAEPLLSGLASFEDRRLSDWMLTRWARTVLALLQVKRELVGLEKARSDVPHLILPLHEGLMDPLVLMASLPMPLTFLVRDELFEWPYVGRFLTRSKQIRIPIRTSDVDVGRLLSSVRDVAEAGRSIVAFPQGSVLGIEVAFRRGVFVIADRLNLPVLPVVITGTHRIWEHPFSPKLRYRQRIYVEVLDPIPAGSARRLGPDTESEMKRIALDASTPAPRRFDPTRDGYWDDYEYEIDDRFSELVEQIKSHRHAQSPRR